MFDPPLTGRILAGCHIAQIPESDIKYKSFLHWWFAVGRKAPALTAKEWGTISGRGTAWREYLQLAMFD